MKIKHLDSKHYLFGNKGACWADEVHITQTGDSTTLCGTPMLSTNWAAHWEHKEPGCKRCIKIRQLNKELDYIVKTMKEPEDMIRLNQINHEIKELKNG